MRFIRLLIHNTCLKSVFRFNSVTSKNFPFVRVVSLVDEDNLKLHFSNSSSLTIKAPKEQDVSTVLSMIKLKFALYRHRLEIKKAVVSKLSGTSHDVVETSDDYDDVCLLQNNEVIDERTPNIEAWSQASVLKIGDVLYNIHFNMPRVKSLSLPDFIVSGSILRPHFILESASLEDSTFTWYRAASKGLIHEYQDSTEWIKVGEGFHYLVSSDDVSCLLKVVCTPKIGNKVGLDFTSVSKNVVEAAPHFPFEERHAFTKTVCGKDQFRCLSYNTLANMYVEKRKFPYTSEKARDVYYRKQLLIRELTGYNSDVICLQEVTERVFEVDFEPVFMKAGYNGFFTRKGGRRNEGVATFFRLSKFRVLFHKGMLLNEIVKEKGIFADFLTKVGGNYKDMSKFLAQDTVLQVTLLEDIEDPLKKVLIANTHLYSNKDTPEVRLIQAALCVYYLEHLLNEQTTADIALLFCGDFNSLPDSEAYNFISAGNFHCCPSWKKNIRAKHLSLCKAKKSAAVLMTNFQKDVSKEKKLHKPHSSKDLSNNSLSVLDDVCASGRSVLDAAILWAMKCINSHYSFSSCKDINELFAAMFPDSVIARNFSCGESKCAYLCHFGLAPHFQMLLFKCLDDVQYYTLLFDESLNHKNQQKQLDIHIRFWHPLENKVRTQYLTSTFLGHSTAEDLLGAFHKAAGKLDLTKLIQISMDGPAVNWKFYQNLQDNLLKEQNVQLISIGSCGLHILNNAFWKGEASTDWSIGSVLSSLYYLFKDCPARREDFLSSSDLKQFPLKFCSHRWLENGPVAQRAILIWEDVKRYVRSVQHGKLGKVTCKSFVIVCEATKDVLFLTKLNFFLSIVQLVCPFLELYQADKPLLPFFAEDILKLIKNLVQLFSLVKSEHMEAFNSVVKMIHFDFTDENLFSSMTKISLGFKADKLLKELLCSKKITDCEHFQLKRDSKMFLIKLIQSLMEKCPVNYLVVRSSACLDPKLMVKSSTKCFGKMKSVLNYLTLKKKVPENDCNEILLQFSDFLESVVKENSFQFQSYDPKLSDLDGFLAPYFDEKKFSKLWDVAKLLMILSHGQASVERGFSVNRNFEVENKKNDSYIAQRIIYDHIKHAGGVLHVNITKELRISATSSRSKYRDYLEEQKMLAEKDNSKRKAEEELVYLKKKKACLLRDVEETESLIENLANEANEKKDINLFVKSHNLRKTIVEKKEEISSIEKQISELGY